MRKLFLIFASLLLCISLYGQRTHGLELKLYGGRVIPHRAGMDALAQPTLSGELNYYFSTRTDNFYDVKYRFPKHGFGLNYNYIFNHRVLGSAVAAYSFMDFSFFDKQWFGMGLRVNAGLAYLTHRYDEVANPENIAVSTALCFYFNLGVNVVFNLPSGFGLRISPGFLHYSNGSVRKPNLGLNDVFVSLALSKDIKTSDYNRNRIDYQENLSSHEAWIMGTCATSDEFSSGYNGRGGGFLCSTLAAGYCYQYGKIGKVGLSFDMLYDENMKYGYDEVTDELVERYDRFADVMRLGVCVGHQLVYHRFELVTYVGTYIYNKVKKGDWVYTRIGGRYYFTNFMFVNLTLKAKGFKAQYIECGLGFSCRKWKKG